MMSLTSCWHPAENEAYEADTIIFLEGAPCYTISISERGEVALEINLQVVRAKEENTTIDAITPGRCLCCSGLVEPRVAISRGRRFETAKGNSLHREELEAVFEESFQTTGGASENLGRVLLARSERARQTLGDILSIIVKCYNRIPLLVVNVRPEGRFRNGWRGA